MIPKFVFITYSSHQQSVKLPFTKVAPVKLVAKLVEIALQVFRLYIMEDIK
jgi:hypothetical protein